MADEIPGEGTEPPEMKGEADEKSENEEVEARESALTVATPREGSLLSDFCEPADYGEEGVGEQAWICEEVGERGEYHGELMPYGEYLLGEEEEEELSLEEKKSLDSEYLKSVLGTPLTFALLEIAQKRPTDPIQFLGHYLLRWSWCGENKTRFEEQMKELNAEREEFRQKTRERERQVMLEKEQKEEELRRAERVESSLEDDEDLGEGQKSLEGTGERRDWSGREHWKKFVCRAEGLKIIKSNENLNAKDI